MFSILATMPAMHAIAVCLIGPPVVVLLTAFGAYESVAVLRAVKAAAR